MGLHGRWLATGIASIDEQHKRIFEIVEQARGICSMGRASDCQGCTLATIDRCSGRLEAVTAQLSDYLAEHFRFEEERMEGLAPREHRESHTGAHNAVFSQIDTLVTQFAQEHNPAATASDLAALLDDWLEEHTRRYDRVLATYIGDDADDLHRG